MTIRADASTGVFLIGTDRALADHLQAAGFRILGQVAQAELLFPLIPRCQPELVILEDGPDSGPEEQELAEIVAHLRLLAPKTKLAVIVSGPHADLQPLGVSHIFNPPLDYNVVVSELRKPGKPEPIAQPPDDTMNDWEVSSPTVAGTTGPAVLELLREREWRNKGTNAEPIATRQPSLTVRQHILVVLGVKGGVGCSLLTVNLSVELAGLTGRRTVLLDLDRDSDVDLYLDLPSGPSLPDLLPHLSDPAGPLDDYLHSHESSGLKVLTGTPRPELHELITPNHVSALLTGARRRFDCVMIDAPGPPDERLLPCLAEATHLLIVTTPGVAAARRVGIILAWLARHGVGEERLSLILNRTPADPLLSAVDLRRMTGIAPAAILEDAGRAAEQSLLNGRPLILSAPDHPLSRGIKALAAGFYPSSTPGRHHSRSGLLARLGLQGRDRS